MERYAAFECRYIPEPNSGCWLWIGMQQNGKEYGLFCWKKKTTKAHRASWQIHRGPIPDGMSVCHHCDNPICVNPDHLFLGTHADNMADRKKKGRHGNIPKGSKQWKAKLNERQVLDIRGFKLLGIQTKDIAVALGVSKSTIERVLNGKTWKHV